MPAAQAVGMRRHLMNLLPTLLSCAPILFVLGMLVLALTTPLPRLAHFGGGGDPGPRRVLIPYARISRDGR
jgi:hypothetical protein